MRLTVVSDCSISMEVAYLREKANFHRIYLYLKVSFLPHCPKFKFSKAFMNAFDLNLEFSTASAIRASGLWNEFDGSIRFIRHPIHHQKEDSLKVIPLALQLSGWWIAIELRPSIVDDPKSLLNPVMDCSKLTFEWVRYGLTIELAIRLIWMIWQLESGRGGSVQRWSGSFGGQSNSVNHNSSKNRFLWMRFVCNKLSYSKLTCF